MLSALAMFALDIRAPWHIAYLVSFQFMQSMCILWFMFMFEIKATSSTAYWQCMGAQWKWPLPFNIMHSFVYGGSKHTSTKMQSINMWRYFAHLFVCSLAHSLARPSNAPNANEFQKEKAIKTHDWAILILCIHTKHQQWPRRRPMCPSHIGHWEFSNKWKIQIHCHHHTTIVLKSASIQLNRMHCWVEFNSRLTRTIWKMTYTCNLHSAKPMPS